MVTPEQIAPHTPWWLATTVDLHHVVGLSLLTIALLRTRSQPNAWWIVLGGVLVLAAPWLRTIVVGTPLLDAPLTPILGSAPNVYYAGAIARVPAGRRGLRQGDRADVRPVTRVPGAGRCSASPCCWWAAR
jgi:hypothetical protein